MLFWGYIMAVFVFLSALYFLMLQFGAGEFVTGLINALVLALVAFPAHRVMYAKAGIGGMPERVFLNGVLYVVEWVVLLVVVSLPLGLLLAPLMPAFQTYFSILVYMFLEFASMEVTSLSGGQRLLGILLSNSQLLLKIFFLILLGTLPTYLVLRISMSVPCRSLQGRHLGLRQSWRMTRPVAGMLWSTAMLLFAALLVWQFLRVSGQLAISLEMRELPSWIGDLAVAGWDVATLIFGMLVVVGVLTTIFAQISSAQEPLRSGESRL
ncbi:MAG: hypothetical protein CR993_07980 [Rhodobacterales bacterium]|nr:MAG: hypothetical protein CR993_07980 [Rhodobacterales bacterium]